MQIENGISVITCCMNRNHNLKVAVKNWIQFHEIDEFIVVDWSSDSLVSTSLSSLKDPRIKIFRVTNEKHWILSYAFNLAARLSSKNKILKLDSDVLLKQDFFSKHFLKKDTYFAGNWQKSFGKSGLSGILFINRTNFFGVNGYNEYIRTYGWDDIDLYDRLRRKLNLKRKDVDSTMVDTLQHAQSDSFSKQSDFIESTEIKRHPLYSLLTKEREFQNMKNRYISSRYEWGINFNMAYYLIFENSTLLKRLKAREYPINRSDLQKSEKYALTCLLRMTYGFNVDPNQYYNYALGDLLDKYEGLVLNRLILDSGLENYKDLSKKQRYLIDLYFDHIKMYPDNLSLYKGISRLFKIQNKMQSATKAYSVYIGKP